MGSSDKTWSTGEKNGKPLQYSCTEKPVKSMKRQKDRTLKGELPRLVGAQYDTGNHWRNNSKKNEETPHVQGKRNPSETVGTERGHQSADRLKQTSSQSDHTDHSLV